MFADKQSVHGQERERFVGALVAGDGAAGGKELLGVLAGIVAGNRNIALFLSVLPQATADELLLFIGCFQIPMYLTPILLGRFYQPRNAVEPRQP